MSTSAKKQEDVVMVNGHLDDTLATKFLRTPGSFSKKDKKHIQDCPECQKRIQHIKEAWHGR